MRAPTPEQAEVLDLLKLPENYVCADCKRNRPKWASCNLGVFICLECSGIHRSLGTHISFVRSCSLDSWTKDQVMKMKYIGNEVGNRYWEARLPPGFRRPLPGDKSGMTEFIRNKYVRKMWVKPKVKPPHMKPFSELRCRSEEEIQRLAQEEEVQSTPSKDDFDVDEVLRQIDGLPSRPKRSEQKAPPGKSQPANRDLSTITQEEDDVTFKLFLDKEENPDFGFLLEDGEKTTGNEKAPDIPPLEEPAELDTETAQHRMTQLEEELTIPVLEVSRKEPEETGPGRFEEFKSGVKRIFGNIFGKKQEKQAQQTVDSSTSNNVETQANSQSPVERFLAFQNELSSDIPIEKSALAEFFREETSNAGQVDQETQEDPAALEQFIEDGTDKDMADVPQDMGEDEHDESGRDGELDNQEESNHEESKPTDPLTKAKRVFTLKPEGDEFDAFGFVALDTSDN